MASWEPALRAAVTRSAEGRDTIERIDHDKKLIVIKSDVTNPLLLRTIEEAVKRVASGYKVVQLT